MMLNAATLKTWYMVLLAGRPFPDNLAPHKVVFQGECFLMISVAAEKCQPGFSPFPQLAIAVMADSLAVFSRVLRGDALFRAVADRTPEMLERSTLMAEEIKQMAARLKLLLPSDN